MAGMDDDARRVGGTLAAILVLVVAVAVWWQFRQQHLPRLVEVRVVFLGEGEQEASDRHRVFPASGRVEAGAVVAYRRGGGPIRWISPFPQVMVAGEPLEVSPLDRWPAVGGELRATWYTVEPSLFGWDEVTAADAGSRLEYRDFLAEEMGAGLRAEIPWKSSNAGFLSTPLAGHQVPGGTLRFRVRVGAYERPLDLLPRDAMNSPGAADIFTAPVPAATRAVPLPEGVHPDLSRVFRLGCFTFAAGVWPEGGAGWPLPLSPREMARRFLITTPESLANLAAGGSVDGNPWRARLPVSVHGTSWLAASSRRPLRWGEDLLPGDSLRVGRRYLVLLEDDGDGVLSLADQVALGWMELPRLMPLGLVLPPQETAGELLIRHR